MQNMLFVTALFLTSCCGIPQQVRLELPPEVDCSKLTNKELINVSQNTYAKVASLYISCVENDKTLRDIIRATQ